MPQIRKLSKIPIEEFLQGSYVASMTSRIKPSPCDVDSSKSLICKLIEHASSGIEIIGLTADTSVDDCDIHASPAVNFTIVTRCSDLHSAQRVQIWIGAFLRSIEDVMTNSDYAVRVSGVDSTSPKRRLVICKIASVLLGVGREREIFRSSCAKCQHPDQIKG